MRIRLFTAPLALLVLASCRNAVDYRREADETAKVYLSAYQQEAVGRVEKIEIETPADTLRRRLMIDQNLLAKDPASFGIREQCSAEIMSQHPVVVTKILPRSHASSIVVTSKPSIAACNAQIGSISVMRTRAPYERSECAQPFPTSP